MATNYPTSIDTNPGDPTPNETLAAGGHANLHTFVQDAMIAVQTYLGAMNSAVSSSITYLLTNVLSVDPGHKHTFAGSITGTVPATRGGTGQTANVKGDLLQGNGANSIGILNVGANNTILVADSTQATGAKWVAPAIGTGPFTGFAGSKFGGTGSDGALNVTSGTTTINLGNAAIFVKNYTSINISVGATVNFSNPNANGTVIILKSQGNITIAGTLDASGMGAQGGASVTQSYGGGTGNTSGNAGNFGSSYSAYNGGPNPGAGGTITTGTGGGTPAISFNTSFYTGLFSAAFKYVNLWTAAGGGSGGIRATSSSGTATSGTGGYGGGTLLLECAGSWNFTGTISVAGIAGGNGTISGGTQIAGMGGGGGAGGLLIALYNTLTASSGTVTVSGGAAGTSQVSSPPGEFGGGGGGNLLNAGGNGTVSSGTAVGGIGATGFSVIMLNQDFA